MKRLAAKARGLELAIVTKALLYPSAQSSGSISRSGGPHYLEVVVEDDGGRKELVEGNSYIEGDNTLKVSNFQI